MAKEKTIGHRYGTNRADTKSNLKNAPAISCTSCNLHKTRKKSILGVGNKKAKIMFIGEAPGAAEEVQGESFVGRAGKLLNTMLKSVGFNREAVYITNVLKFRSPGNRSPTPKEIKLCLPYLQQEIALIQPKIIVALGRTAARTLLNTRESIENLRSHVYQYGMQKIVLLVTYHPAYLLRMPGEKKKANIDFLRIKKFLISKHMLYKSKARYLR